MTHEMKSKSYLRMRAQVMVVARGIQSIKNVLD